MSDNPKDINISNANLTGNNIVIGGIQALWGAVHNVSGNVTIGNVTTTPEDTVALRDLIAQLETELKKAEAGEHDAAILLAERAKETVEAATKANPDKKGVESKVNLLKEAAENIQGALPVVFAIAMQIVVRIVKLGL